MTRVVRIGALAALGLTGALATAFIKARPSERPSHTADGTAEPALDLVDAGFGGRVSEVLVKEGDIVQFGAVLVRLDNAQLTHRLKEVSSARQSLASALREQAELQQLPPRVKQYLYLNYPDVVEADVAYNRALSAIQSTGVSDRAAAYERLSQAAEKRVTARKHLQHLFSTLTYPVETHELLRRLDEDESEARKLLYRTEPKATGSGTVELLDLHSGDTLLPGAPIALIRRTGIYSSSITLSMLEAKGLHTGAQLKGTLQNGHSLAGSIQSVVTRSVLSALRHKSSYTAESVISIRIDSAEPIETGARIRFDLP